MVAVWSASTGGVRLVAACCACWTDPKELSAGRAGDPLDVETLAPGFDERDLNRGNVGLAMVMVAGATVVNAIAAAQAFRRRGAV